MKLSFSDRTIPVQSIKKNRKIQKAIDAYKVKKVSMKLLMTNFLAVKSKGDKLAEAENPWAYFYKGMQGHEVESGVSVDETLFRFSTMEIKDQQPTDVINAAFYANKKRNDSDFELGYLLPEFLSICRGDVLVANPSPDIVREVEGCQLNSRRVYAVSDETVAKLYKIQFPNAVFITFDQVDSIHDIQSVLIINRDQKLNKADELLECLRCCSKESTIVALVPSAWFDNPYSGAYNAIKESGMTIKQMLIVDTKATASSPRKKVLVLIESEDANCAIEVKQSAYDLNNRCFKVLKETAMIDAKAYLTSEKTILSCFSEYFDSSKEVMATKYRKAEEYSFSKEISLFYRVYADRKNRYAGIAYYRELLNANPNVWGRKRTANIEKGLRSESKERVIASIENVPFYDEVYPIIRTDIQKKYIENKRFLTLKTIWYCCWLNVKENKKYNHEYLCGMMENQDIAGFTPMLQSGTDLLVAIAKEEGIPVDEIPYLVIEQFNIILASAVKSKVIVYNPLDTYIADYSKRATGRQQDVRNALVKKHFTEKEEKAVVLALVEKVEKNGERISKCVENSLLLATAIRLFTGMAIREVAALTWGDYKYINETGCNQFQITKFVDTEGRVITHSEQENWKRFRIVPVTAVLADLLGERKKYLLRSGIKESELDDIPIIIREEWISERTRPKTIGRVKSGVISSSERELIKKIGIPEKILILPDDRNELSTDFNRYHGDIFLSNFKHKANHEAYMTMGEINYMIGIEAPDTFSRYYCDYTNNFMQDSISQKLRRWSWRYERLLDNSRLPLPTYGEGEGEQQLEVGPFSDEVAAVDVIVENTSESVAEIIAECKHGLNVNKTEY